MICYHGTCKKAAAGILKEGFWADTWFATHLNDAVKFGGSYVFEVEFEDDPVLKDWQFHHPQPIPTKRIVSLKHYPMVATET